MYLAGAILFLLGVATLPIGSLMLLVVAVALFAGGFTLGRHAGAALPGGVDLWAAWREDWIRTDPYSPALTSIGGPLGPDLPEASR